MGGALWLRAGLEENPMYNLDFFETTGIFFSCFLIKIRGDGRRDEPLQEVGRDQTEIFLVIGISASRWVEWVEDINRREEMEKKWHD